VIFSLTGTLGSDKGMLTLSGLACGGLKAVLFYYFLETGNLLKKAQNSNKFQYSPLLLVEKLETIVYNFEYPISNFRKFGHA
jgi:hypothetical protein